MNGLQVIETCFFLKQALNKFNLQENYMKTSQDIIKAFIESGYKHMENIPNNRVYYTENSCSTIAWAEDNVVIEHYLLLPNLDTPIHSHPFDNQMIFIEGDLTAWRQEAGKPDTRITVTFAERLRNHVSTIMSAGGEHGFTTGERGAVVYNIQIWPEPTKNPLSATIEYSGTSMGPRHDKLVEQFK